MKAGEVWISSHGRKFTVKKVTKNVITVEVERSLRGKVVRNLREVPVAMFGVFSQAYTPS